MTEAPDAPRSRRSAGWLLLLLPLLAALALWWLVRPPRPAGGEAAPSRPAQPSEAAISALNGGVRLLEQLQPKEAAAKLEEALRLHPDWVPAEVDLAIARLNQLDPATDEAAADAAAKALEHAPEDARAAYVLAYVRGERQRKFDEALPLLRRVVELAPRDASAWAQLGRAAQETAAAAPQPPPELVGEAERAFRKALEIDPRLVEANYRLGRLLLDSADPAKQKEGEQLLANHQKILEGRPNVQQNYFQRGALALAYPWMPPRPATPAPKRVSVVAREPLALPTRPPKPPATVGLSAARYRDGLTIADMDGDGRLDVLAPMRAPSQQMLLSWAAGDPGFGGAVGFGPDGRACSSAPAGDLDRDGDLDVFVTCNMGNLLFLGEPGGTLVPAPRPEIEKQSTAGFTATLVDADHDGDLDVHVVEPLAQFMGAPGTRVPWESQQWLWRNDGAASFASAGGAMGLDAKLDSAQMVWADFDGDNAIDLVASLSGSGLSLLRNDHEGHFSPALLPGPPPFAGEGPPPFLLAALDPDLDRDVDLVILDRGRATLLLNDSEPGAPRFLASATIDLPPGFAPGAVTVADMDLDGFRELVLFGAGTSGDGDRAGPPALLSFTVEGRPVAVPARPVAADGLDPQVVVSADMDGDGDPDLVARTSRGEPVVLANEMPAGPAWVGIALAGREGRSNPQGFGARVTVDSGSMTAFLEHASQQAPLCHAVAPEIVGLGARTSVDGVGVLWPSGIQQAELDVPLRATRKVEELDRQPSSCPMLYAWDGAAWQFQTDCFDTAPLGLWVAPGVHVTGEPDEMLRLRPGVVPQDGVVHLAVSEFLNESLLADRVALLAVDEDPARRVIVDEGVRLAAPAPADKVWSVASPLPVRARLDGRDVTEALAEDDRAVAGWSRAERFTGLAAPHELLLDVPAGARVLVLSGALNFPNSTSLFGAAQAGLSMVPPKLEAKQGAAWKELAPEAGVPAGFHKDVVLDLAALAGRATTLRLATNMQVSWDRAVAYADARPVGAIGLKELRLLSAEKRRFGIPSEIQGPENRWREFPHDVLDPRPDWVPQSGTITPDGDVSDLVAAQDARVAVVRPAEEILLAFDDASAAAPPATARTRILVTRGWVKDRDPHTALSGSVDPLPEPGSPTYP